MIASSRFLRITPQKLRAVANEVRGRRLDAALSLLARTPRRGGVMLKKLLKSAQANAESRDPNLKVDSLVVASLLIDGGPVFKRWLPRAHGRATPLIIRTSHARVTLGKVGA